MTRRLASVAIAASMLLALGACKSSDTSTTTQATQAQNSTTSKSETKDTKAESGDTDTTKKSTGTTTGRSTGTTTKGGDSDSGFTAEQEACIKTAAEKYEQQNPDIAKDGANGKLTAEQAGVVGGLMVACVPKPELVTALTQGLKKSDLGKDLSTSELQCIKEQILALDTEDLAVFVGILIFSQSSQDKAVLAPQISKLNTACNTKMAA